MSKVNIKVQIKNNEHSLNFNTKAIIQDNVITYNEEDNTKVKYNYKTNELKRENLELLMKYKFTSGKITKGIVIVKELNKELEIDIDTKKIIKEGINIEVEFEIEKEKFLYRIEEVK